MIMSISVLYILLNSFSYAMSVHYAHYVYYWLELFSFKTVSWYNTWKMHGFSYKRLLSNYHTSTQFSFVEPQRVKWQHVKYIKITKDYLSLTLM